MKGPHKVIEVFFDGMAVTRDLNGMDSIAYVTDVAQPLEVGDYVSVACGCVMEKLDSVVAEQAIAMVKSAFGGFALESALGDDCVAAEPVASGRMLYSGQYPLDLAFS